LFARLFPLKNALRFALNPFPVGMPAVKIFAFLDLAQNCSFLNQKRHLSVLNGSFFDESACGGFPQAHFLDVL